MQIQACIALCEQRCMPVEVHIEASKWEAAEVHADRGMHRSMRAEVHAYSGMHI
jgi:hypothetical protein